MAQSIADLKRGGFQHHRPRRRFKSGIRKKRASLPMRRQQRLNMLQEVLICATRLRNESLSRRRFTPECFLQDPIDFLVCLRRHGEEIFITMIVFSKNFRLSR